MILNTSYFLQRIQPHFGSSAICEKGKENVILSRSAAQAKNLANRRTDHEILRPAASE